MSVKTINITIDELIEKFKNTITTKRYRTNKKSIRLC